MNLKDLTKEEAIREIRKYIEYQIDLIERKELSSEAFAKAAWPYYQACNLGQKKSLNKLLKALPDD